MRIKKVIKTIIGEKNANSIRKTFYLKKLRDNKELSDNICSNNTFYNKYKDKRCFILGNGPSLKKVDFSLLQDEIVFTVNNFSKVKDFELVKPDYHLWIDPAFFNLRDDMKYDMDEVLKSYKAMKSVNPVCFVPDFSYDFIKSNKIDEYLDIHYLAIFDTIEKINLCSENFNISSLIPSMTTVVQYAIAIAIYMGFKEIYLLGCDTTGIQITINCALEFKNDNMHAYGNDNSENEIRGLLNNWSMSRVFYDQYILFLGYEKIYEYCKQNKIHLVNCSEPTLITSIPKMKFSDVISQK